MTPFYSVTTNQAAISGANARSSSTPSSHCCSWALLVKASSARSTTRHYATAYDELTEEIQPFAFTAPLPREPAYVLSLGGKWLEVRLNAHARCLSLSPGSVVQSGMSGSPLVYADG